MGIEKLTSQIANGELESQREQTCQHSRVSSAPMSGFCLDCGTDLMVEAANDWLRNNPIQGAAND